MALVVCLPGALFAYALVEATFIAVRGVPEPGDDSGFAGRFALLLLFAPFVLLGCFGIKAVLEAWRRPSEKSVRLFCTIAAIWLYLLIDALLDPILPRRGGDEWDWIRAALAPVQFLAAAWVHYRSPPLVARGLLPPDAAVEAIRSPGCGTVFLGFLLCARLASLHVEAQPRLSEAIRRNPDLYGILGGAGARWGALLVLLVLVSLWVDQIGKRDRLALRRRAKPRAPEPVSPEPDAAA